jgi:two-component system nitrate/nitrite response regulator NarP
MKPISILLVDENPLFLDIISRFLLDDFSNKVVLVGKANTLAEAESLAQRLYPEVILVDHGLPGQKGLACVAALRRLVPEVAIIVLTLLDKPDYRRSALDAGADEFLRIDKVFQDLLLVIHRAITARTPSKTKLTSIKGES